MSCRQKYWRSSCDKDPACTWQDDALTAKRHMVFHAFNVLSHASVGFSSRGVCREKTAEELAEAQKKAQEEQEAALKKAQEDYAAALRNFTQVAAAAHGQWGESMRNLNERRRRSERTYRQNLQSKK